MKSSKEEIVGLKETLSAKEKELEKLKKNLQREQKWVKIILPIAMVIISAVFFNKLTNANKQLELKDEEMNQMTKELILKESKMNEIIAESLVKDEKFEELRDKLNVKEPQIESLMNDLDLKDEEIDSLTHDLALKTDEHKKLIESTYFVNLLFGARAGTPKTLYTNDEEKINLIISVANESLFEDISSCYKADPEFDLYTTCFRDLSIELHNKLEFKFGPHWIVTTGKVATCFMVTTMSSEHEEYFFRVADIYFEVFKYRNEVINKKIEEYFQDSEDTENTNHSNVENIVIEKVNQQHLENNLEAEENVNVHQNNINVDENVDENDENVDENDENVDENDENVDENVAKVEENVVKVDENVVKVDENVVKVDENVVKVDENVVKVDENVVKVDENVVKVDENVAKVEENVVKVDKKVVKDDLKAKENVRK